MTDPAARLRQAATVLTAVDSYLARDITVLPQATTDAQWDAVAEIPTTVRKALAAIFGQWARLGELDPDLLNRVGGPETVALADALLGEATR